MWARADSVTRLSRRIRPPPRRPRVPTPTLTGEGARGSSSSRRAGSVVDAPPLRLQSVRLRLPLIGLARVLFDELEQPLDDGKDDVVGRRLGLRGQGKAGVGRRGPAGEERARARERCALRPEVSCRCLGCPGGAQTRCVWRHLDRDSHVGRGVLLRPTLPSLLHRTRRRLGLHADHSHHDALLHHRKVGRAHRPLPGADNGARVLLDLVGDRSGEGGNVIHRLRLVEVGHHRRGRALLAAGERRVRAAHQLRHRVVAVFGQPARKDAADGLQLGRAETDEVDRATL
mmetsp:Transcript_48447/g.156636  ORF Transcript_48447/g.156636 Transcript_48447/m.156636 type:complete len:287 (-) Transcript_48447:281-1141(-)